MPLKSFQNALLELADHVIEVPGPGTNPRIVYYDSFTTLAATNDAVPWCSAFVCAMVETSGLASTKSAAASSWLNWGVSVDLPSLGSIVVFKRIGGHHVGFVCGERGRYVAVLGGNQGDKVCVAWYDKANVLGYRDQE